MMMRGMLLQFFSAIIALCLAGAAGAEPSVQVRAAKESLFPGEPVRVSVTIEWQAPEKVFAISVPETLGDLECRDAQVVEGAATDAGRRVLQFSVTAFEPGKVTLSGLEIPWSGGGDSIQTLEAPPVTLEVKSYLDTIQEEAGADEPPALRPAPPPQRIGLPGLAYLYAALIVLVFLVAGVLLWRYLRRRGEKEEKRYVPPPPLPPDEEALRALAQMEMDGAVTALPAKDFYSRLSYILRRYLGRRYRFEALEMTSTELLRQAHRMRLPEEVLRLLEADAEEADSVKFAKVVPPEGTRRAALERARHVVTQTRPAPLVEEEAGDV